MGNAENNAVPGSVFQSHAQAASARCAACAQAPAGLTPLSEHALAAAQQLPGLAGAHHRQFLQVSPAEIVATGVTATTPDSVTFHLEGPIAAIPHNLDLNFTLDLASDQLVVTLNGLQPVAYQGFWTFKFHPGPLATFAPAAQPRYSGTSLVAASLPELGGVIGCILKCLGPQVIAIVLECLPALITGKEAFLACLVQQAQSSLPNVVQCIQQCK